MQGRLKLNFNFWFSAQKFLDTEGDLMKLRHEIQKILPVGWSPSDCLQVNIEAKDWVPFENSKFQLEQPCKAPIMKNMPPNYRLKLKPNPDKSPVRKVIKKKLVKKPVKRKASTSAVKEVIELSDSEVKDKKMKQQKINQMKKVL